jgi:hypothetical protein
MKKVFKSLGRFFGHLVMGFVMFAGLLFVSAAVNLLTHWVAPFVGDTNFVLAMTVVETVILWADVGFVVWWSVFSTFKAAKALLSDHD